MVSAFTEYFEGWKYLITLIGVLAMICFIICRRVYVSYVILNFGCCPLNGLGRFGRSCSGCCQSLSAEMSNQDNYEKFNYNGHCNLDGVVLEEKFSTEEECGDSQKKEASLWQNLKKYFGFEHSASHDCRMDLGNTTNMKLVNAPEDSNNAEESTTSAEKTSIGVHESAQSFESAISGYPGGFNQVIEEIKDPMSAVSLKERRHTDMELVNPSEENNLEGSMTSTEETSNDVQASGYAGYAKNFDQRNQVTEPTRGKGRKAILGRIWGKSSRPAGHTNNQQQVTEKIKDPMNAVSLKERRRMVKELVLLDDNPKPVYDYLVPINDSFENEYIITPTKEDVTLHGFESTESTSSLRKSKNLSSLITPTKEDISLNGFESTESTSSLKKSKNLSSPKSNPVTLKERKLSSHESFALKQKADDIEVLESYYHNGHNAHNDSKSVHSFQESFGQEIINATEEKSSTQESIMESKEEHNSFNAVGERIVVNVRAVVTKE